VASNDDWAGDTTLAAVTARVGAFSFGASSSLDAALYLPALASGGYSAQIESGDGGTGVALAEIYDATPAESFSAASSRITNISARARVAGVSDSLTAGFVLSGTEPSTLLIRAIGPSLAQFGINEALADPKLDLFAGSSWIQANDNWTDNGALSAAAGLVGAFPLPTNSKDAGLLVTLSPGAYSAQISGVGNSTGIALIEIFELP
jgi:hypothetical protein